MPKNTHVPTNNTPTIKGWYFVMSSEDGDIIGRGQVIDRLGEALLLHVQAPVNYAIVVPLDDMKEVALFPNVETLEAFLELHAAAGGVDNSLRSHFIDPGDENAVPGAANEDPQYPEVDIADGVNASLPLDAATDSPQSTNVSELFPEDELTG